MARFVESRRVWTKGDWGNLGAFQAGQGEDGWFKARNMVVYDDGSIGPRTGPVLLEHTGMPTGIVRWCGYAPASLGGFSGLLMFVVANKFYWAPAFENGPVTEVGTLPATETAYCSSQSAISEGIIYLALPKSGVMAWSPGAGTITQVLDPTSDFPVVDLVRYKERLYAGSTRRVFYSDAADFASWDPDLGFIDVGWQFVNYRMGEIRNNLYFLRQGGGHYVMSGTPESTAILRAAEPALPPDAHSAVFEPYENAAYWIPQARNAPVRYVGGIGDIASLRHLEDWTTSPIGERIGVQSFGEQTIMFLGSVDQRALTRHNEVWTQHTFDLPVGLATRAGSNHFVLVDPGTVSTAPAFYQWRYGRNRPGLAGSTDSAPGDDDDFPVEAWLTLPEWWAPDGRGVHCKQVDIDFTSWGTGTEGTAHFDLVVTALRRDAVGAATFGGQRSKTYSFDETVSVSGVSGTERRIQFNTGDQGWGRGYQLEFTNIRNVSFRSVSVSVDAESRDPR